MMLDTLHPREHYLEKSEQNLLLRRVVAGDVTFAGRLEEILASMEKVLASEDDVDRKMEAFRVDVLMLRYYLEDVLKIGAIPHEEEYRACHDALNEYCRWNCGGDLYGKYNTFGPGGLVFLFVRPFRLAFAWDSFSSRLGYVRRAAGELDLSIGRAFILDDIETNHERFRETYHSLMPGGRTAVNEELRRMLSAGCLDMGENELDNYLAGLAGKEETPDG